MLPSDAATTLSRNIMHELLYEPQFWALIALFVTIGIITEHMQSRG